MYLQSARSSYAWILAMHVAGAAVVGGLESLRLGSASLALVLLPVFAVTGLVAGTVIAVAERIAEHRRWWAAALIIAAPSLLVTFPIAQTLFDGAYAQTLPLASVLPFATPIVAWLGIAVAVAIGRRLGEGDLTSRAIAILAVAGVIGGIIWAKRHVLGSGYLGAHDGATLAVIVLAGSVLRLARRVRFSAYGGAAVASITIGMAIAAFTAGLDSQDARRTVATYGDHSRDLVRLWRQLIDLDRDGSSPVLGGGDCDDRDPALHPGAIDVPGDGIDQDCDGADAKPVAPAAAAPRAADLASWRAEPATKALLDRTKDMNVLLISVDALRFDPLAPGAAHREDFPRLVKLLDESVWFTRAFAPGAGTDISLGTLLTGRHDPFQRVATTLPEAIQTTGRTTSNALPTEVLRHVGEAMLTRGFDKVRRVHTDWDVQDVGDHVSAGTTTNETLRSLDAVAGKRFFLWAHYFDVHEHHQLTPPGELMKAVDPGGNDRVHRYRALLYGVDRSIGRLLDELDARGLRDSTIVIFLSDHGESLKEDPRLLDTHGFVAYAPLVRIPIAFRIPGVKPGQRVDPVSLVDIAPTLLDLIGGRDAMTPLDGIGLVPTLLDAAATLRPGNDRALVIHEERQWSVVEWPYQLLVKPADDLVELYDVSTDPALANDLSAKLPDVTRRLRARYAEVPAVKVDRTPEGRAAREQLAQPPPRRATP